MTCFRGTLFLALTRCSLAVVLGGVVIPHGDFAYDPTLVTNATQIHAAAVHAGVIVTALQPDIVLLSTPHGMALDRDFLLYGNSEAAGFAMIGDDLHNESFPSYRIDLHATLEPNVSSSIESMARVSKLNVSTLVTFADSEAEALRCGEVIPLSFLNATLNQTKVVVLSQPTRRYTEDTEMVPELLELGARLYSHLHALPERVVVLISSDLAHTHKADGPYGFSEAAAPFDAATVDWAETLDDQPLLDTATGLVDDALSCGFTGLVLLHGLLTCDAAQGRKWRPELLAYAAPTYYGMLAATFLEDEVMAPVQSGQSHLSQHRMPSDQDSQRRREARPFPFQQKP